MVVLVGHSRRVDISSAPKPGRVNRSIRQLIDGHRSINEVIDLPTLKRRPSKDTFFCSQFVDPRANQRAPIDHRSNQHASTQTPTKKRKTGKSICRSASQSTDNDDQSAKQLTGQPSNTDHANTQTGKYQSVDTANPRITIDQQGNRPPTLHKCQPCEELIMISQPPCLDPSVPSSTESTNRSRNKAGYRINGNDHSGRTGQTGIGHRLRQTHRRQHIIYIYLRPEWATDSDQRIAVYI